MVAQLVIVSGFLIVIAVFTKATLRDFGLPANSRQFMHDVAKGAAACLAALAPVHILQIMLMSVFFPKMNSGHPLIKMVMDAPPDPWILLLTGVAAVVVAPIYEEIAFRMLLQGWLERWEDERLARRTEATEMQLTNDEAGLAIDEGNRSDVPLLKSEPLPGGIARLPHGWFPIIVSSIAFGLAHLGYGPEPLPLSVLGLVLGYLYQRTHRIVPGIVTHALFNLFTMIVLWRMIYHHG
jgi:membrane protease YdiL (CAAX protease family)